MSVLSSLDERCWCVDAAKQKVADRKKAAKAAKLVRCVHRLFSVGWSLNIGLRFLGRFNC